MTAEVGVLNRIGVALAADSAVTIGAEADKIYTSADKLFHLSTEAPVGIMINGSANYLGVPWETIIKDFRSHLGTKRLPHLEDYADQFFGFIRRNRSIFPAALQDERALGLSYSLFLDIRETLRLKINSEAESRNGLEERDIREIISIQARKRLDLIKQFPLLPGFGRDSGTALRRRYSRKIASQKREVFGRLPISASASRDLTSVVIEMLRRDYFGPFLAGVVVAGFGDRDYMPKLIAYEIEEMVLNRLRMKQTQREQITQRNSAAIIPFAQQEMVHSFLRGIDPDMFSFVRRSSDQLFTGAIDRLIDNIEAVDSELGRRMGSAIRPEVRKMLDSLFREWEEKSRDYWEPIVEIASSLPKDELAAMAESLVNLTKFRRRISTERETVGGPIDVAIITKGDGFVWVKRKHYFDAKLNPRVIGRYSRDGG